MRGMPKEQPDKPGRWRFSGEVFLSSGTEDVVVKVKLRRFSVVEIEGVLYPCDEDTGHAYVRAMFTGWWVED